MKFILWMYVCIYGIACINVNTNLCTYLFEYLPTNKTRRCKALLQTLLFFRLDGSKYVQIIINMYVCMYMGVMGYCVLKWVDQRVVSYQFHTIRYHTYVHMYICMSINLPSQLLWQSWISFHLNLKMKNNLSITRWPDLFPSFKLPASL